MKNIAVILSAGKGTRLGGDIPKQFLEISGRTILELSISAFQENSYIDEIAVVVSPEYMSRVGKICENNNFYKVKKILCGGKERYNSSVSAIKAYRQYEDVNLIFHDCARPLVTQRIINDTIMLLKEYSAVGVAVPSVDTVWFTKVDKKEIDYVPERNLIYRAQTPQGFNIKVISKAYDIALKDDKFVSTDDCGVVSRYLPDVDVGVVMGEETNIKVTYSSDIKLVEQILNTNNKKNQEGR